MGQHKAPIDLGGARHAEWICKHHGGQDTGLLPARKRVSYIAEWLPHQKCPEIDCLVLAVKAQNIKGTPCTQQAFI
jgi:hypothetical protein